MDGETYETIYTLDSDIRKGINYIRFDEELPAYRFYRFYNAQQHGC